MQQLPDLRRKGSPALGVHLTFLCPEVIEVCGLLGFEWILLDAEHTPLEPHRCRDLVRAAEGVRLPCIVRIPEIRAAVIEGFLDSGVCGIMAANVGSAAEAKRLVAGVKFSPEGQRGAAHRTRAGGYGFSSSKTDFYLRSNATTLTIALIESRNGIDALDSILAVPGLDYIALGANDLGLSMGTHGAMDDPAVRALLASAHDRVQAHGKSEVAVVGDAVEAASAIAAGAQLVAIPDTVLLAAAARGFLGQVNHGRS